MNATALLITLAIGAVAGWLAGHIMRGSGLGLIGNIIVGILGAVIGGWLFQTLGVHLGGGLGASLIQGVSGSIVLLFLVSLIK